MVFAGTHLIAVSYWDSRLTTFPVASETGLLGEAAAVYADPGAEYVERAQPDRWEHLAHRQRWPHLHQVNKWYKLVHKSFRHDSAAKINFSLFNGKG